MHAYNVNQGTYDFFSEFQTTSTPTPNDTNNNGSAFTFSSISNRQLTTNNKYSKQSKHRNALNAKLPRQADSELDEFDTQAVRFKPESLDNLVKLTKFNRRELKLMYRGFKQLCPSGVVKEDKFKLIYAQFFPRGADTNGYARFVFNSFDIQRKQEITFTDFVIGLSVLTRGTIDERLRWIFTLYDLNGDGIITRDELSKIINSVYDLMGKFALSSNQAAENNRAGTTTGAGAAGGGVGLNAASNSSQVYSINSPARSNNNQVGSNLTLSNEDQAENLFKKFDLNNDGVITLDEFLEACHKDDNIIKSISVFNTIL